MKNANIDVVMDMFLDGDLPRNEMIEMQHAIETENEIREVYQLHLDMKKNLGKPVYQEYRNVLDDVYAKKTIRQRVAGIRICIRNTCRTRLFFWSFLVLELF